MGDAGFTWRASECLSISHGQQPDTDHCRFTPMTPLLPRRASHGARSALFALLRRVAALSHQGLKMQSEMRQNGGAPLALKVL